MRKTHFIALAAALLSGCATARQEPVSAPKNVILMIGDGMGFAQVRAWRGYADDPATPAMEHTVFDPLLVGAVATQPAEAAAVIADSAATATAYATGVDSYNSAIGVGPDRQPLPTVLEQARRQGKATGLVSTSQITHATPAAFATHVESRQEYAAIADQLFDNQIDGRPVVDVLLGGGRRDLIRDDRDVAADFAEAGYAVVTTRDELATAKGGQVLGLFADVALPREWDRSDELGLAELTTAAIERLSRDEDGFFLMIEGSQIDWAAHGNDIVGVISEMQGFAGALERVLAYARESGNTLVLVTADHETGGLSIASEGQYEWDPAPLRGMRSTPAGMVGQWAREGGSLADIVEAAVAFELTADERRRLANPPAEPEAAYDVVTALFDARTGTGWTSGGHTGVDVPLYAYGPGSEQFRGLMDNERVGQLLMELVRGEGERTAH